MILTRRRILGVGGGFAAALVLPPRVGRTGAAVEIAMRGRDDGSHVWFDPIGILIQPGQTIRWTNLDRGNSHTTTAYSPKNLERPLRMPKNASPWNSDYLLPFETFSVTLTASGVYDYYCIPHEHAGMVGRIIVGEPESYGWAEPTVGEGDLPRVALDAFPDVKEILTNGIVRRVQRD